MRSVVSRRGSSSRRGMPSRRSSSKTAGRLRPSKSAACPAQVPVHQLDDVADGGGNKTAGFGNSAGRK